MAEFEDAHLGKMIQGYFAMAAMMERFPLKIKDIEKDFQVELNVEGGITVAIERDENGNYLDYFTIITESGLRFRVTVELEQ